jgi:lactate dehydrogenase-like 2-hydroxyacid dehydrogenase
MAKHHPMPTSLRLAVDTQLGWSKPNAIQRLRHAAYSQPLDRLRRDCPNVDVNAEDRALTHHELLEAVRGRNGVLSMLNDRIDDAVLAAAGPQCRVFASMAAGFDNVDLAAATRRGVLITNTPGVLTETTADLAWALMLAVARRIVEGDRFFRTGRWTGWGPLQFPGTIFTARRWAWSEPAASVPPSGDGPRAST